MTFHRIRHFLGILVLLVVAAMPAGAAAQGVGKQPGIAGQQREVIAGLTAQLEEIEKRIAANAEEDARLVEFRLKLDDVARALLDSGIAFRPRLREINARLEQLGPAPAADQPPEPELVAAEREGLLSEKGEINAVLGMAEALSIRINGMVDRIATLRSDLFRNQLTKRYQLTDAFDTTLVNDVTNQIEWFWRAVSSWMRFVFQFKFQAVLGAAFLAMLAAVVLLVGGKRVFRRFIEADPAAQEPSYLSRLSVAFWSTLLPTITVGVFLGSTYFFFDYYNVLRGDIGVFMRSFFLVAGVVYCVNRLARATLSPSLPNWRVIAVETGPARWLVGLVTAMAVVMGASRFLSVVNEEMSAPLSLTIARSFLATIVIGILLILIGMVRPYRDADGTLRPWPAWLRYSIFTLGGITILAALLGYIGFANFVSLQVVVTGTILLTAYIGLLSSREIGAEGGFAQTSIGRRLAQNFNVEESTLDQLGLVVSVAVNLMILLVFLPLILLTWGFQPGDIEAWSFNVANGFTIGTFSFSPLGIMTGIVVFVLGYFLTRWFQGWLDGSVMARGKVDAGVRNSIRTVVGYAGLAIAGLVAVSAAGIDLSNLALIAGGLSLGIGFGLQNVVSNFVSGLILLAERPFKAGDWIVAGAVSGTVKKISVRATEIETFQRQTVILPNSELINSAVGNWTHRNKLGRIEIPVGVAYGTDVRKAHAILLELAHSHPLVLKNPEPFVLFAGFGDSSLDFEVRVFLGDVTNGVIVQNDLRFAIIDRFEAEGIEIPFPQRVVTLKSDRPLQPWEADDEAAEAELMERAAAKDARGQEPAKRRRGARKPDPE